MDSDDAICDPTGLEGTAPEMSDHRQKEAVIEQAFDYRGDVTLYVSDGRTVEGYVFDRRRAEQGGCVRVMQASDGACVQLTFDQIERIQFSGRDTAAGKSWESWLKKYQEKKKLGQPANI